MSNRTRQATPFPVPSNWAIYITSGGRPNTTGSMQITSWQNNTFGGTINFRGVPLPLTGSWNPATYMMRFESPYVLFQGRLVTYADSTARYWRVEGPYSSKSTSDYPGSRGTFLATTTTL